MPKNFQPLFNYVIQPAFGVTLSASGNYAAGIYQLTPGLTVTAIEFYATASTSGVVNIQLETIASDVPTGTLIATGASLLSQSITANTWHSFTLTTPYVVPTGSATNAAAVIRWSSGSSTIRTRTTNTISPGFYNNIWIPRIVESGIQRTSSPPAIVIKYSDGTYAYPCAAPVTLNNTTFTDSTNPDEIGNAFTCPFNFKCYGIIMTNRLAASVSSQLRIYDSNLNVLTVDNECAVSSVDMNAASSYSFFRIFQNPIYLSAGQRYVVAYKANSTATSYNYFTAYNTQELLDASSGLVGTKYASRNNSTGSFTETDARIASIAPLFDTSFSNRMYFY